MASTNDDAGSDSVPLKRTKIEREPNKDKDAVMNEYETGQQHDASENDDIDILASDQIKEGCEGNKTWMLVSPNEISVDIAEEIIDVRWRIENSSMQLFCSFQLLLLALHSISLF